MIFIDKMKDLKIYKRPLYLPTSGNNNKKTKSAILLLTPNKESSIKMMNSNLIINKKRFSSYYIEKDLSYYITGKKSANKEESDIDESLIAINNDDKYIRENVICNDSNSSDAISNIFSSYIRLSGYCADLSVIKDDITPFLYYQLFLALKIKPMKKTDIPILNIVVTAGQDEINQDCDCIFNTSEAADGFKSINITVCGNRNYIINSIIYATLISLFDIYYPICGNTYADRIMVDYITDSDDGYYSEIGSAILDGPDSETTSNNINKYFAACKNGNIDEILINISAVLQFDKRYFFVSNEVEEVNNHITMENLANKFKYMSTTKFKKKFAQNKNVFKRLQKDITDSIKYKTEIKVPNSNYHEESSSIDINDDLLSELNESEYLKMDNVITFFNESTDSKYNSQLRNLLYKERIMKRKDLLNLYADMKTLVPDIMYTYIDLPLYKEKNIYIDLYFYNQLFFKNNLWTRKKGYNIYLELLNRLINDPKLKANGYSTKTIFIPVLDWSTNRSTRMWLYNESINPISIIYDLIKYNSSDMKKVFGDTNIIFFSEDSLFKINMSTIDPKKDIFIFKNFISKIINNEQFDAEDIDNSMDKENSRVIKTNIYDSIDVKLGVDLTGRDALAMAKNTPSQVTIIRPNISTTKPNAAVYSHFGVDNIASAVTINSKNISITPVKITTPQNKKIEKDNNLHQVNDEDDKEYAKKQVIAKPDDMNVVRDKTVASSKILKNRESEMEDLATIISDTSKYCADTDSALNQLDTKYVKSLLVDINSMKDDSVKIDASRAARMNKLNDEFLNSDIENVPVKEIINPDSSYAPKMELASTNLPVSSPNPEWKNLTYVNFDKGYDIYRDIIECFYHFTKVSKPYAIRNIDVKDHSTSEDRLDLYTVECEDFKGKRFTIKLDIPVMKDNRFLLRGNYKAIQNQLFNMPILKTDLDTCQIISNYQKIFIRRYNSSAGKSYPSVARLLKTISKYKGNKIKVTYGNNSKVCNKYELPIDYIDLASVFNKIEFQDNETKYVVYFNQDEIRETLKDTIDESKGVPVYTTKSNSDEKTILHYFNIDESGETFTDLIVSHLSMDKDFDELYKLSKSPRRGTYSNCSILNTTIPLVIVCGYCEGLTNTLNYAHINYSFQNKIDKKNIADGTEYIKFEDGYLVYKSSYVSDLLLNGLEGAACEIHTMGDADTKQFYLEALDNYGGRIKADGLDNFYDCLIDPITEENLKFYHLPTSFVSILLYANAMLADNKFVKHTEATSRRLRRYEQIAAYTYEALSEAYASYANAVKHNKGSAIFSIKQSAVIDKVMTSPIMSDDSVISALNDVETTNAITYKGKAGLNNARSYSIDKRTYDDSMLDIIGMSTGFSGNVGITRQATMDLNLEGERGYIKSIEGNTEKMNAAKTLCATEALTPFGTTRDDGNRTDMTFIQTAKHMVRTKQSDPLLVTNGADEALPYMTTDKFAFKAKADGKIIEYNPHMIIVQYDNDNPDSKDYINLDNTIEKNSDGGFYVPMKLTANKNIKVGYKFKKNEILAYDNSSFSNSVGESDNIAYDIGTLAKVAIIDTDEGFEDSGICTENLSKKLSTEVIQKEDRIIGKDSIIYYIAKVGDQVKVNDPLLIWQDPKDSEEADVLAKMMNNDKGAVTELGKKTIKSPLTGTIVGIKMYRTANISEMSTSMKKMINEYEKPILDLKKKLEDQKINTDELPATYALEPTGKLKKAEDAVLIEFYVQYIDTVAIGDKITYYSANKAVIKNVIPQENAPYTDFRPNEPIDAMVAQTSIDKRMVTSTLVYGSLQKMLVEMDRSIKDMLGIPYDDSKV